LSYLAEPAITNCYYINSKLCRFYEDHRPISLPKSQLSKTTTQPISKQANTPSNKSWPDVAAGRSFTYQGDPNHPSTAPEQLLIAGCTFVLSHSGYESLPGAGAH
jgi:hypothetical protein